MKADEAGVYFLHMDYGVFNLPKAVIFDLDGLLINTDELIFQSVSNLLSHYGYTLSPDLFGETLGNSSDFVYQKLCQETIGKLSADSFWQAVNSGYEPENIRLKPGAIELLTALRAHSVPAAIATNSTKDSFIRRTSHLPIYDLFHQVITAENVAAPKPAPDIYLQAARSLGVAPQQCLVLDDSPAGITSGYRAGCQVGFVPNPYVQNPARYLIDLPVALFSSLAEVRAKIFA